MAMFKAVSEKEMAIPSRKLSDWSWMLDSKVIKKYDPVSMMAVMK